MKKSRLQRKCGQDGGDRGEEQGSVNRDSTERDGRRGAEEQEKSKNVFPEPLIADGRVRFSGRAAGQKMS